MGTIAPQITSLAIVYSTVYLGADQRKHQSSAPLAFVRGIHRGSVNSPHKWPVTRKMFPFDDVIMNLGDACMHLWMRSSISLLQVIALTNPILIECHFGLYQWPKCGKIWIRSQHFISINRLCLQIAASLFNFSQISRWLWVINTPLF